MKYTQEIIDYIGKLFIEENKSKQEISEITNIPKDNIKYILRKGNIVKSKEQQIACKRRVLTDKYGVDAPLKNKDILNKMKQTNLERYGCENPMQNKDIQQKVINTNLEKYGVEYLMQNDEIKAKSKQTSLERYGVDAPMKLETIKQKQIETVRERYGADNPMQVPEIRQKVFTTNLEKYGSISPFGNKEIREKIKQNNIKKYGVEYPVSTSDVKDKKEQTNLDKYGSISPFGNKEIREKVRQEFLAKYGVENYLQLQEGHDKAIKAKIDKDPNSCYYLLRNKDQLISTLRSIPYELRTIQYCANSLGISATTLYEWINQHNIKDEIPLNVFKSNYEIEITDWLKTFYHKPIFCNTREFKPYELDIYMPEDKVAIEFNGTYWHSTKVVSKNYHYEKSKYFEDLGIRVIHIFEYEWTNERQRPILENIIKNAIGINTNKIYARKCNIVIKKSTEMREFFDKNNIQGFRRGKFAICLTYNNEIVMSYIMGSAFFGKGKYEWEVIRGATKLGYTIVGGASKIFSYFIKHYDPANCVYYIDYNYFNGNSLKNLPHMTYIKTQPSFKNWWVNENKIKNRDPAHHKEISALYKKGLVIPIYNAGTKVYVWEKEVDKDEDKVN